MPIFTIDNFTSYNTQDIEALFTLVEDAVMENRGEVLPSFVHRWSKKGERLASRVTLKTYTPGTKSREVTRWTQTGRQTSTVLLRVKESTRPSTDIRIVTPDALWDSPLEALAVTVSGEGTVPVEVVEQMVERIGRLYDVTRYGTGRYEEPRSSGYRIRIESRAIAKVDAAEKQRTAIEQASGAYDHALYHKLKVNEYCQNIRTEIDRALRRLERSKIPPRAEDLAVVSRLQEFVHSGLQLEQALRAAKP